jgi:hypothetical protein
MTNTIKLFGTLLLLMLFAISSFSAQTVTSNTGETINHKSDSMGKKAPGQNLEAMRVYFVGFGLGFESATEPKPEGYDGQKQGTRHSKRKS